MPYLDILDFKYGMDRRRPREVGVPGTLWLLRNAHITRGGDIERVKKFVERYTLPAGTHGLAQVRGQLYAFGSANLAASMPLGVLYQRLQAPSGSPSMTRVLDVATFDGKFYVIAEFSDGNIYHFFDGSNVAAWQTLASTNATREVLADFLATLIDRDAAVSATAAGSMITITAVTPGTSYTISASTVQGGGDTSQGITLTQIQANVPEVEEVLSTGSVEIVAGSRNPGINTISSVTVEGVELLSQPVDMLDDHQAAALALAIEINNGTLTHGYTATAAGDTVTIAAEVGTGSAPNGYVVGIAVTGDVVAATTNFSGGVDAVAPVAQVYTATLTGSFNAADIYRITINGTVYAASGSAAGMGSYAFTYKQRMYSVAVSNLHYSKLEDPTDWQDDGSTPETDGGFVNMANESEGSGRLVGLVQYNDKVAIFSADHVRIYTLSQAVSQFAFVQSLDNTGTIAPQSLLAYGNNDVFYLDSTGIRSLRARDSSNAAYVSDIGSVIDPYIQGIRAEIGEQQVSRAIAIMEPVDGRYWLALGPYVIVLSNFPGAKITAWSVIEPGFVISDLVRVKNRVYARSGDTIYLYGGESGNEYPEDDEQIVTAETAFLDARSPATHKALNGIDLSCTNVWSMDILVDPADETKIINAGRVGGSTFVKQRIALIGDTPLFALRFVCRAAGYARLSRNAIHYDPTEAG
ncbi:hypothetical protein [Rhodoligotrophos defluvii]|uniref:hypothetical protein n=1 Tax=Rhodoligotrophos defluvii TaxID=2561934 RepID=UPI0010C99B2C|nr:hypothetical protein [Rhodoligotrophos defluvii]